MVGISVIIAIVAMIILMFLWAWHFDRTAKRSGTRTANPATMPRSPEAAEHLYTIQSHTGV